MANLSQLLNEKKEFLVYTFANLIVQLGITYYIMEKVELSKDSKIMKNFYLLLFSQILIIFIIAFFPAIPIWIKFILFSIFSVLNGFVLSTVKKQVGEDIIKMALLGTASIFAVMFSIGTFLIMSGIKLTYRTGIILFYGLFLLLLARIFSLFNKSTQLSKSLSSIGIILFSGYIIYDTNKILQRNYFGDFITASIDYYLDIINIFVDIVNINN